MISGGVSMSTSTVRESNTPEIVRTAATTALSRIPAQKLRRTPTLLQAPKNWAVTMENPEVMPMTKPRTRNSRLPVLPTPARAVTPMVLPTIRVSAIL